MAIAAQDVAPGLSLDRIDPRLLVVFSRATMALGTPIIAFLIVHGPSLSGGIMMPISFCNVLFVGNMSAALVVAVGFGLRRIFGEIWNLSPHYKLRLFLMGASSSVLSALIFLALETATTTVANALLLGRVGPVLYAVAGAYMIRHPIKKAEWLGFAIIGVGVVATVVGGNGFFVTEGDIYILASCVFYAITNMLSRGLLKECSLSTMVFARNFVSGAVFFVIALLLFNPMHFADALSGELWIIMSIYALVVVVSSQFTWYSAISRLEPSSVAKWTVMAPAIGIAYAFVINGEQPTSTQLIALAIVSIGIVVTSIGGDAKRPPKNSTGSAENSLAAN